MRSSFPLVLPRRSAVGFEAQLGPIVVTWVSLIGGGWRWWDPRGRLVIAWAWFDVSEWLKKLRFEKQRTCWVRCPRCEADLNGWESERHFVSDTDQGVCYVCDDCGTESLWDFDAPAPILRRSRYVLTEDRT
jgi:hypothetical protein